MDSSDINFLIYSYLIESGFNACACLFVVESNLSENFTKPSQIPINSLTSLIHKGLLYQFIENKVNYFVNNNHGIPLKKVVDDLIGTLLIFHHSEQNKKENFLAVLKSLFLSNLQEDSLNQPMSLDDFDQMKLLEYSKINRKADLRTHTKIVNDYQSLQEKLNNQMLILLNKIRIRAHRFVITSCLFNPHERSLLASISTDGSLKLWDFSDIHSPTQFVMFPRSSSGAKIELTCMSWNQAGTAVVIGCYDGYVSMWSFKGVLVEEIHAHDGPVVAVQWNCSDLRIASVGTDSFLSLLSLNNLKSQVKCGSKYLSSLDWNSNDVIAVGSSSGDIYILDILENQIENQHPKILQDSCRLKSAIISVKWCKMSLLLASSSLDHTVKIWADPVRFNGPQSSLIHQFDMNKSRITQMCWTPKSFSNKSILACTLADGSVHIFHIGFDRTCTSTMFKHNGSVNGASFDASGEYLATVSSDKTLRIWNVQTGKRMFIYNSKTKLYKVNWNCDGDTIAVISKNYIIAILDIGRID